MKKNILKLVLYATLFSLHAANASNLIFAPANFSFDLGTAVFIDFIKVDYKIEFDGLTSKAKAVTTIHFTQEKEGYPLFDLVANPTSIAIDGQLVAQRLIEPPGKKTHYRVILKKLLPGAHQLIVEQPYDTDVEFRDGGVASAFFFIDWNDRSYIEQYLPSNLEYDQYESHLTIEFKNMTKGSADHDVFTNGNVTIINASTLQIAFPKFYNCASFYFQMAPKGTFVSVMQNYTSIDGRSIPITIFSKKPRMNLEAFMKKTGEVLQELETDYGAFPHEKVVIYASDNGGRPGLGGMEYSGATISAYSALDHELFHSYHARSLAPADGNSGWMDEAIASWRDAKYRERFTRQISTNMAGRNPYIRYIGMEPYDEGEKFMENLAAKATQRGLSLKTFLKNYFQNRKYTVVNTTIFKNDLESYLGLDLTSDFDIWVYGKGTQRKRSKSDSRKMIPLDRAALL